MSSKVWYADVSAIQMFTLHYLDIQFWDLIGQLCNIVNFSGKMRFGNFDVTEAQFSMIALMLITSVFGSAIWKIEVKHCS
jgi:hypothetical protein